MGAGVDEGGRGERVAEGEGRVGEVAGWEGVLGGDWELAWGREGGLNGGKGGNGCQCVNGDRELF